ncbi:hypothetical protein C488_18860 [Natrinema pellirubrum DSM 15624]|uniref:Uncharacterized protein n=1 Tax=Natrinema pellirubrum (strain DSM 15624 / CIP 106293 / JCM 10476 / NCIMB 786 / 157) TaxID=797303 RepID=L0JEK7_NATP1|nr:hypothetical protein [Natrinema pellirubrum]AGB29960.1 hypothetical protein Natpe_0009 [Natrinema pellirubrum DSM 15624]ELY70504.1 hypothetical protein C488_18860 [Natrinema pellirubrum DSM 15624]
MALQRLLSGDPSKRSKVYLAIGALSLAKAIAVRNDRKRFRRELRDAGLFLGVGLALRRFGKMRAQKRRELESQVPDWAIKLATSEPAKQGVRNVAKQRLGRESEPQAEPSLKDRAQRVLSSR